MKYSSLPVLLSLLMQVATTNAQQPTCPLCPNNGKITCGSTVLRDDGQTCAGMANEMASLDESECEGHQVWTDACCDLEVCPPDLPPLPEPASAPAASPSDGDGDGDDESARAAVSSRGSNAPCYLCRDGSYPGKPYTLINLLGYGEGTCHNWYYYALEGNVVRHQCDALMYFAYEPCGCGKTNTNPAPPRNTPRPTPRPTSRPAQSPYSNTERKTPNESKENVKLSNNRGGAGAAYHGGRQRLRHLLKGSHARPQASQ